MVSVVLPVYNGEDSLELSINSVLEQTYTDFEFIIVNDCSTDDSLRIIEKAMERDSRVKCISNETNQKLPNSLNIGFKNAQGEYLTWTSHDNLYHKDALKIMVEALENDSSVGMVYCDFVAIDENGNKTQEYRQDEPESLAWKNPIGACFMYRKSIAEVVGGYDKELFLAEDYEYWLRIWEKSKIVHIPEILYFYRKHGKSLTEMRRAEIGHKTVQVWMKHWNYIFPRISGVKNKLQFCYKIVEMESEDLKKSTFKNIAGRYGLFRIYYLFTKSRDFLRGKEKR